MRPLTQNEHRVLCGHYCISMLTGQSVSSLVKNWGPHPMPVPKIIEILSHYGVETAFPICFNQILYPGLVYFQWEDNDSPFKAHLVVYDGEWFYCPNYGKLNKEEIYKMYGFRIVRTINIHCGIRQKGVLDE